MAAVSMVCGYCHISADHQNDDCPHKSKIIARKNSLRKAPPVAGPGSESERGKNPAKPMKLRDMKKTGVKDSRTQHKKEKVVEEAMAQLQLDEENTTTPKSQPLVKFGGPFKFTVPCEVCGVVGHYNDRCPYIEVGLPDNVTEAPKGYEIVNLRGGKRAVRIMFCGCCKMLRDHKIKDCPNKSEMTAIMNSILKAARPPAGPLSSGSC
ncbi:unnamed protein product [Malus baccata var. baccata]